MARGSPAGEPGPPVRAGAQLRRGDGRCPPAAAAACCASCRPAAARRQLAAEACLGELACRPRARATRLFLQQLVALFGCHETDFDHAKHCDRGHHWKSLPRARHGASWSEAAPRAPPAAGCRATARCGREPARERACLRLEAARCLNGAGRERLCAGPQVRPACCQRGGALGSKPACRRPHLSFSARSRAMSHKKVRAARSAGLLVSDAPAARAAQFEHPRCGSLGFLPKKRSQRHQGKGA